MTWQLVALVVVVAVYALGVQAIHAWKEVRMVQRMSDEMLEQAQQTK